jgi:hypothetical protein
MTKIKAMVLRYSRPRGTRIYSYTSHVIIPVRVRTKITAMPMPVAVSIDRDTPKKGQLPRNLLRRMLFTSIALIMRRMKSVII